MESWLCGTPVLVNADCEVTKEHCIKSNGGLYFWGFDEFEECLNLFIQHQYAAKKMGINGKQYVLNNYNWNNIVRGYENIFKEWGDESANSSDTYLN